MKKIVRATVGLLLAGGAALAAGPCLADSYLEAVPTAWRMQNYIPNTVWIFYTGAACVDGRIKADNMSDGDKNRLWSTVLTARSLAKNVGIYYSQSGDDCEITSFFLKEN